MWSFEYYWNSITVTLLGFIKWFCVCVCKQKLKMGLGTAVLGGVILTQCRIRVTSILTNPLLGWHVIVVQLSPNNQQIMELYWKVIHWPWHTLAADMVKQRLFWDCLATSRDLMPMRTMPTYSSFRTALTASSVFPDLLTLTTCVTLTL